MKRSFPMCFCDKPQQEVSLGFSSPLCLTLDSWKFQRRTSHWKRDWALGFSWIWKAPETSMTSWDQHDNSIRYHLHSPWIKAKMSSCLGGKSMGPEAIVSHRASEFSSLTLPGRIPPRNHSTFIFIWTIWCPCLAIPNLLPATIPHDPGRYGELLS